MFGRWGVVVLGTLALAAVVGSSAAAHAQQVPFQGIDVSSNAGVAKFLTSHGVNPKGVVIQRGKHNYAGPSCPGVGWTCTSSKKVVQITFHGNDSQFQCTASPGGSQTPPDTCTVIQVSAGGTNDARCSERTRAPSASQSCIIEQTNTTGDNRARIEQAVDANGGAAQDATQYAGVIQTTGGGGTNVLRVSQSIRQSTSDVGPGGSQTQNGHQGVSVNQTSDTGDNGAFVEQSLAERAQTNAPTVSQNQNTTSSGLNTSAGITQHSNTGRNFARLNQSNDLDGNVGKSSNGSQTQGTPGGGLLGHFDQFSSGLSVVSGNQRERQNLRIGGEGGDNNDNDDDNNDHHGDNGGSHHENGLMGRSAPARPVKGIVSQTQYGPMHYGSQQRGNPGDVYNISHRSSQHAATPTLQDDRAYANCDTDGNCTVNERISQNGQNKSNTCTGQSCHIGVIVTSNSDGTFTSTCSGLPQDEGSNPCPSPPSPPPPPPTRGGCEFACETTPTTTTVTSSDNAPYDTETVTFTATVTPSDATGTVTFRDGDATLCADVLLAATDSGKQASCVTTFLSVGTHVITGTYSGDSTHAGSSGAVTEVVHAG